MRSTSTVALIETKPGLAGDASRIVDVGRGPELTAGLSATKSYNRCVPSTNVPTVLVRLLRLRAPVTTPDRDQPDHASDSSSVDAERAMVAEAGEDRVRDRADAGLDRRAVRDPLGDERRDPPVHLLGLERRNLRPAAPRCGSSLPPCERCSWLRPEVRGMHALASTKKRAADEARRVVGAGAERQVAVAVRRRDRGDHQRIPLQRRSSG